MRFLLLCPLVVLMLFSYPANTNAMELDEEIALINQGITPIYQSVIPLDEEDFVTIGLDEENPREYFKEVLFSTLPEDVLNIIGNYADLKGIKSLSITCHGLNKYRPLAQIKLTHFLEMTNLEDFFYHKKKYGSGHMVQVLRKVQNLKGFEALAQLSALVGDNDNKLVEVWKKAHRYRYSLYFWQKGGRDILKELSLKLNRGEDMDVFSCSDLLFSTLRDPYFRIFFNITSNIIYPAAVVSILYYSIQGIREWYFNYYNSPNFHPVEKECREMYRCGGGYFYGLAMDASTHIPNMTSFIPQIQSQCNASLAYAEEAANFFNSQLSYYKAHFNDYLHCGGCTSQYSECTREGFLRKGSYLQRRKGYQILDISLKVDHFYPECNAAAPALVFFVGTFGVFFGIVGWVCWGVFLCMYSYAYFI